MTFPQDPGDAPDPNENPTPASPAPPAPPIYAPGDPAAYPSPGPVGYAPAPPMPKKKTNWLGIAVLVGIVAVLVIGFILFRDRLPNDVNSLAVGECFDEPAATTTITDVQRQPCNVAHDDEVFFLVTDTSSGAYPGVDHFRELASEQCLPAATAYLGADFDSRSDIDAGYLYPTSDSWANGDRGITCYLYRVDQASLTTSVRNIGASPLP